MIECTPLPSPNFDERASSVKLRYIVLHYTGMPTEQDALERLVDPSAKVSAHYAINESGKIYALVDESKRAWHAGKSYWLGETDINSASIGIELVNPGHEFGYRPFPEIQISALENLLTDIIARNCMDGRQALLAHSDIAPDRKQDPGELFPWKRLANKEFGLWPASSSVMLASQDIAEMDEVHMLAKIGYDTTNPQAALTAFHRRYRPENPTDEITQETLDILNCLCANKTPSCRT